MTESNVHRDRLDHREPPTIDATHVTHVTHVTHAPEATDGPLDTTAQLLTRITAQLGSQLGRVSLSAYRHP